jgi:hypothetical protein
MEKIVTNVLVNLQADAGKFQIPVIGRTEGDWVFRLQNSGGGRTWTADGATTPLEKKDYFVDEATDSNMNLV